MTRIAFIFVFLASALQSSGWCAAQFLVRTTDPSRIQALSDRAGLELVQVYKHFPWALYRAKPGGAASLRPASVGQLFASASIRVEPDVAVHLADFPNDPNDDEYPNQNLIAAPLADADTHLREAWSSWTDASNVTIAIIDSGVDLTNTDLTANLRVNVAEKNNPNDGIDNDGDGKIDDVYGWNTLDNSQDIQDSFGHGTEIAGIIGATGNNGVGTAGVCWKSRMLIVRAFHNENDGTYASVLGAFDYIMNFPDVKIVNASWTIYTQTPGDYQALNDAVTALRSAGVLLVAAAGNGKPSSSVGADLDSNTFLPASYNYDNIVSVASVYFAGSLSSFSNYGSNVTLAAPGEGVWAPTPGGGFNAFSGTSFAAPFVTGAAALLLASKPSLPPAEVKHRILVTSRSTPSLSGIKLKGGLLDVLGLLQYTPPNAADPSAWRFYPK